MYKYDMTIDGTEYKALFADHFEASDFLDEIETEGSEIVVYSYTEVTPQDILADNDFEWSYRVEMASTILLPNHTDFKKWFEQEAELKRLGFIS